MFQAFARPPASPRRALRSRLIRTWLSALLLAVTTASAAPRSASAQDGKDAAAEEYRQHMENGVKLYQDRNYAAAVVEFEAAYKARPRASPLVNISLCHKSTFAYTKAIVALETALAKHADTMSDQDKKAAADAITEMRGLLAHVTIEVSPKSAVVSVDGEDVPAEALATPLALSPGTREIAARAEGHTPDKRSIKVASGDKGQVVSFVLQPVRPPPPGDGVIGPPIVPPPPPKPAPRKPTPRGIYVVATGAIVGPLWHPEWFFNPEGETGGVIGGRVGYRVNNPAAFELMLEYGNVTVESKPIKNEEESNYSLSSTRLGANLRLMTPGDTFRVLGVFGGGLSYVDLTYEVGAFVKDQCESKCTDTSGFDPFVMAEVGGEFDLGNVLVGATFVGYFEATKGLDDSAYGNDPLVSLGGRVHVGYAFW